MARKVFISFLGGTNYGNCHYFKGDFMSDNMRYCQIATLDYLQSLEKWSAGDAAYILLTEGAKAKNWVSNGHTHPVTKEPIIQAGLQECLAQKHYPFFIDTIEKLPDGKNEEEIFVIFDRVFEKLQPEDELHFDITHAFRYLPMLVLVLANYSKFLKGIKVKAITYGNYETRIKMEGSSDTPHFKAPIIDLLPLSLIQNWTFAAADYLRNGKSDRFVELATDYKVSIFRGMRDGDKANAKLIESLAKNLRQTTEDFQTCRGPEILSGKHVSNLKMDLSNLKETAIKPLKPLVEKLNNAFKPFTAVEGESAAPQVSNGFAAAKWCWDNKLYQQAVTILQENVVSYFCHRYQLDISNRHDRELVNIAFAFIIKRNNEDTTDKVKEEIDKACAENEQLRKLLADPLINNKDVYDAFNLLTNERNDINHNGMRKNPHKVNAIRDNIKKALDTLNAKFVTNQNPQS